ncbi:MAG TPA: efflux RND transporter periplasmic adaptor subunit [Bryobacteraceae bacterium]|nr:efflux RND transporter periplasmic adaptor subunit [Bryobacteraceae bacterium]
MPYQIDEQNNLSAEPQEQRSPRMGGSRLVWFLAPVVVLVIAGIFTLRSRAATEAKVAAITKTLAVQHVSVVHPKRGDAATELSLPGTTEAFTESPIFARTNGYLKSWTKDIGAHVKAGELLAVIQTPELDQQLMQARGQLAQTEANLKLAKITAGRYQDLINSHSVSQQNVDQGNQEVAMLTASAQAAAADVQRLEQLQAFERVCAPFDGIVTARNTDIGDLINAGSSAVGSSASGNSGMGQELFRVARIDTLRIYVNVPEDYSGSIKPGVSAKLSIAGFPGREFLGRVARYAHAVDVNSRTMRTEIDIPNPGGILSPGAYASAAFSLRSPLAPLILPANTLIFQAAGMQVGVVDQNGRVQLRSVTIGRDFGTSVEVLSGLQPADAVITNPSDSLNAGGRVAVENVPANAVGS